MSDEYLEVEYDTNNTSINHKIKGILLDIGYSILNLVFVIITLILTLVGVVGIGYGDIDNNIFYLGLSLMLLGILGVVFSALCLPILYYKAGVGYLGKGLVFALCSINILVILILGYMLFIL